MRPRLLITSVALHTGLLVGAAAWAGAGTGLEPRDPARIAFRPSEAAVAWAEPVPPTPDVVAPHELPPDPRLAPEPPPEAFEPPPPRDRFAAAPRVAPLPAEPRARVRPAPPEPEPAEAEIPAEAPGEVAAEAVAEPVAEPPAPVAESAPAFVAAEPLEGANQKPEYPREAVLRGWTGTVALRLSIDAHGRVVDVTIVTPCRHAVLNRAAVRAAKDWVFEPARRDGVAVASDKDVPVDFVLVDR